jgi:hypothetical protein
MNCYAIELLPPLGAAAWQPQFPGDTPKWHFNVFAMSAQAALETMEQAYPAWPKRVVPGL